MQPPRCEALAEFTLKAVAAGVLLGVVFGAANAYLGLRVGMTVSASIPAAVMTVALFKLLRARGTLLEANLSQTIGSASTSLASGTIFTIPALFLWGLTPPRKQRATRSCPTPKARPAPRSSAPRPRARAAVLGSSRAWPSARE